MPCGVMLNWSRLISVFAILSPSQDEDRSQIERAGFVANPNAKPNYSDGISKSAARSTRDFMCRASFAHSNAALECSALIPKTAHLRDMNLRRTFFRLLSGGPCPKGCFDQIYSATCVSLLLITDSPN